MTANGTIYVIMTGAGCKPPPVPRAARLQLGRLLKQDELGKAYGLPR